MFLEPNDHFQLFSESENVRHKRDLRQPWYDPLLTYRRNLAYDDCLKAAKEGGGSSTHLCWRLGQPACSDYLLGFEGKFTSV